MEDNKNEKKNYLKLDIKTSLYNDSYGIFNYKEKNYKHAIDEVGQSYYYFRKENNTIDRKKSQQLFENDNDIFLFRVRKGIKDKNKYEIINPISKSMKKNEKNINQLNSAAWYVIRPETNSCENDNESYILNENDILKFGRKKYEVIRININNGNNTENKENNLEYNISQINKEKGSIFDINIEPYQYSVTENIENQNVKNHNYNKTKNIGKDNKNKNNHNNNNENNNNNANNNENNNNNKNNNENNNNNDNNNNKDNNNNDNKDIIKKHNENQLEKQNDEINGEGSYSFKYKYIKDNSNSMREYDENERCRICYSFESTKENPKLRICLCKTFIHFECLKKYICTKIEIKDNADFKVQTYICPKFNCEVCLTPYPLSFRIKEYNKIYQLIDYNIPTEFDYLVLESLDYLKEHANIKIIHVVQLSKDKISIGRKNENDIIDTDISVSRNHAVLKYNKEKGNIIIENRSEKYGTLVLIKGNIIVKEKKIGFQVGKSYVTASMIKKR